MLTRTEVAPVARVIEDVLGAEMLDKLRAVWRKALRTADDDSETMLDLGRQWCKILGTNPDTDPNTPADPGAAPDPSGTPDPSGGTPRHRYPQRPRRPVTVGGRDRRRAERGGGEGGA